MKSANEIKEYLLSQEWLPEFIYELVRLEGSTGTIINRKAEEERNLTLQDYLEGKGGERTILSAFGWLETEQGWEYWRHIQGEFKKWYNEPGKIAFSDLAIGEIFTAGEGPLALDYIKVSENGVCKLSVPFKFYNKDILCTPKKL